MTGSLTLDLVVLALSLALSGFFSSAETALTALTEAKARQLIEAHPRRNGSLALWLDRPNRVLTTILIGNNVVNTFTAALATLVCQRFFSSHALSITVGITTIAILIAGEITPKTFAKHNAERVAPVAMNIVVLLHWVMFPVVYLFTWMSKVLVRLSGGEVSRSGPFVTEEDIAFMIDLGQKEGVIEEEEQRLLSSIFEFGDTVVREVMIPRTDISSLPISASLEDVLHTTRTEGHTRMPVYGDSIDDVRGLFHAKELLAVLPHDTENFSLENHLHDPFFVPEQMKISELLKEFQRRKTHLAIVVDEYGGTAGLISLEDILEEIVGEISDEYDDDRDDLRKIDDDHYVADGKVSIRELAEVLPLELANEIPYETLGGFLIAEKGRMPSRGERLRIQGWLFVIAEVDARRITTVEIERLTQSLSRPNRPAPSRTLTVIEGQGGRKSS